MSRWCLAGRQYQVADIDITHSFLCREVRSVSASASTKSYNDCHGFIFSAEHVMKPNPERSWLILLAGKLRIQDGLATIAS